MKLSSDATTFAVRMPLYKSQTGRIEQTKRLMNFLFKLTWLSESSLNVFFHQFTYLSK
jgi:hypothetical protein